MFETPWLSLPRKSFEIKTSEQIAAEDSCNWFFVTSQNVYKSVMYQLTLWKCSKRNKKDTVNPQIRKMASVALRMTSTGTLTLFALSSTLNLFNMMKTFSLHNCKFLMMDYRYFKLSKNLQHRQLLSNILRFIKTSLCVLALKVSIYRYNTMTLN